MSTVKLQGVALGTFKGPEGKDVLVYITREWLKLFTGLSTADIAGFSDALDAKSDVGHVHISTEVTDFEEATQDVIGAMVTTAGGSYDDTAGTITLPSSTGMTHPQVMARGLGA